MLLFDHFCQGIGGMVSTFVSLVGIQAKKGDCMSDCIDVCMDFGSCPLPFAEDVCTNLRGIFHSPLL